MQEVNPLRACGSFGKALTTQMDMGMSQTTPDTEKRTSSNMHDAGCEDVVRQKHRRASHTKALLEHHYNGCDSVGSLDTEVIILP
jgi:hypothetical protein